MTSTIALGGFTVDAILCDSAMTADGKLFIQGGGWNMLVAQTFPFHQSRIGLGFVIGVPYAATNRNHTFQIKLTHEDGSDVPLGSPKVAPDGTAAIPVSLTAQFNVGRPPTIQPGDSQVMAFAVNLDQLRFELPGAYAFVFSIDDNEVERLPFRVSGASGITIGPTS